MASSSRWRCNNLNPDVLYTATFETREWKKTLAVNQFYVVYRVFWVNRLMGMFSKEPMGNLIYLVELLLGYEDRIWKDSEEEAQYILSMNNFTSFYLAGPQTTWQELFRKGRTMDLFKDILRFELVDALPTIYWVNKQQRLFLLVGPQNFEQTRALFLQLTDHWNQHLQNRESDRIHLPDLPVHRVSLQTMELALFSQSSEGGSDVYEPGVVYNVFMGIAKRIQQTVALLPAPIEAYLQHLWTREVHINMTLPERRKSQNTLKLVMPRLSCPKCGEAKEVGIIFGLRATVSGNLAPIEGLSMYETLQRLQLYRSLFALFQLPDHLNVTVVLCQAKATSSDRGEDGV